MKSYKIDMRLAYQLCVQRKHAAIAERVTQNGQEPRTQQHSDLLSALYYKHKLTKVGIQPLRSPEAGPTPLPWKEMIKHLDTIAYHIRLQIFDTLHIDAISAERRGCTVKELKALMRKRNDRYQ